MRTRACKLSFQDVQIFILASVPKKKKTFVNAHFFFLIMHFFRGIFIVTSVMFGMSTMSPLQTPAWTVSLASSELSGHVKQFSYHTTSVQ